MINLLDFATKASGSGGGVRVSLLTDEENIFRHSMDGFYSGLMGFFTESVTF